MKYHAWLGEGDWSPDAGQVEAPTEAAAAEAFAQAQGRLEEDEREQLLVSLVPDGRPHRRPSRWDVRLVGMPWVSEDLAVAKRRD